MKPLSGLDSLFLHLETPQTPMHVGALHLLEPPAGGARGFAAVVRRHVAARLHLLPVFTRTLAPMPLSFANPVWVAADHVDLEHHVRRLKLRAPGTQAQLEAIVARLHGQLLPRDRPLWRFYLIEGLASGQLAFYSKVHHAALDGAAGVALAHALLDVAPLPREVPPPGRRLPGEHPGLARLVGVALKTSATQTVRMLRQLPHVARVAGGLVAGSVAEAARRAAAGPATSAAAGATAGPAVDSAPEGEPTARILSTPRRNLPFGPATPLNVPIDGHRTLATLSLPLAEVRQVASVHRVKLNDVVLAITSGALRRYLAGHGGVPEKPLVAAVPVSLRTAGDTEATTLATITLVNLATELADPRGRLEAIRAAAGAAKTTTGQLRSIIPTDFPSLGVPWLLSAAASVYGTTRLAERIPPIANLVVSNLQGPTAPLYLAGARLVTFWPLSIVEHGLGLNITVHSYAGSLDCGLVAARNAVPDLGRLAVAMLEAFEELKALDAPPAPARLAHTSGPRPRCRPPTSTR